jgi:hypothetical protein
LPAELITCSLGYEGDVAVQKWRCETFKAGLKSWGTRVVDDVATGQGELGIRNLELTNAPLTEIVHRIETIKL